MKTGKLITGGEQASLLRRNYLKKIALRNDSV